MNEVRYYQRCGIGTELMNRMIVCLKKKKIFMISVIFDESLREFYHRFGFFDMLAGQLQTFETE
jgi:predicted N-acetyltransferase YhbS